MLNLINFHNNKVKLKYDYYVKLKEEYEKALERRVVAI